MSILQASVPVHSMLLPRRLAIVVFSPILCSFLSACVVLPIATPIPVVRDDSPSLLPLPTALSPELVVMRIKAPADEVYEAARREIFLAGHHVRIDRPQAREFETDWKGLIQPQEKNSNRSTAGIAGFFNFLGAIFQFIQALDGGSPTRLAVGVRPESDSTSILLARVQSRIWVDDEAPATRSDSGITSQPTRKQVELAATPQSWQANLFTGILRNASTEAVYSFTKRQAIERGDLVRTPYGLAWREWRGEW